RLGCEYVGEDGQRHTPVLMHRAVTGSWERFYGMLIEHYAGAFPVWLSPVQASIIPITDRNIDYAREVERTLKAAGIRTQLDLGDARMNAKIRDAQLQKIPYMLVIGDKEQEAGQVAVRLRNNQNLGPMPVADFLARVTEKVRTKDKEI
ncbi:MAG: threonine--tRNA ligase, partial [Chloroflexi bacterium]|nr:threonine--tRNA ligase [Chloroflexota bacterium]